MSNVVDLPKGETADDAGQEEQAQEQPLYVEQHGQIVFEVVGKAPTSQSLRLYGGKIELTADQVVHKGDWLELRVIGVVRRQGFVDTEDEKTSQVVSCDQQFGLKVKRLEVVGPVVDPTAYEAA